MCVHKSVGDLVLVGGPDHTADRKSTSGSTGNPSSALGECLSEDICAYV